MASPIWKDRYITLGSADVYLYRIRLDNSAGTILYTGRAYKRPNESTVTINVNGICADYLTQELPALTGGTVSCPKFERTFYVEASTDGETFSAADTATLYLDWSNDYGFAVATEGLHCPITGEVAASQLLILSTLTASAINYTTKLKDGTTAAHTLAVSPESSANGVVNLAAVDNLSEVTFGSTTFKVVDECTEYALYYVNAYGGWDSLLIKGRVKKSDNYTRHTQDAAYSNAYVYNRGARNYANEISRSFSLHTGWLNDAAASRMHHLLGSTLVYLYDFTEGQMIPVTIDDTVCDYKTYHGEGNKLIGYTLTLTESHEMIRR